MGLRLIVGLGNPTAQYAETRHNAGFLFLDRLAAQEGLVFAQETAMHGMVATWRRAGETTYLLKPMTYMNRSGLAVRALTSFYRIDIADVLVVHDELEFQPGVVRLKKGGGHGGHNGLRDIITHTSADFLRLRLGIGHPGDRSQVLGYVLGRASVSERQALDKAVDHALAVLPLVLEGNVQKAMNALH